LAISGVNAGKPGDRDTQLLVILHLGNRDYSTQAPIFPGNHSKMQKNGPEVFHVRHKMWQ